MATIKISPGRADVNPFLNEIERGGNLIRKLIFPLVLDWSDEDIRTLFQTLFQKAHVPSGQILHCVCSWDGTLWKTLDDPSEYRRVIEIFCDEHAKYIGFTETPRKMTFTLDVPTELYRHFLPLIHSIEDIILMLDIDTPDSEMEVPVLIADLAVTLKSLTFQGTGIPRTTSHAILEELARVGKNWEKSQLASLSFNFYHEPFCITSPIFLEFVRQIGGWNRYLKVLLIKLNDQIVPDFTFMDEHRPIYKKALELLHKLPGTQMVSDVEWVDLLHGQVQVQEMAHILPVIESLSESLGECSTVDDAVKFIEKLLSGAALPPHPDSVEDGTDTIIRHWIALERNSSSVSMLLEELEYQYDEETHAYYRKFEERVGAVRMLQHRSRMTILDRELSKLKHVIATDTRIDKLTINWTLRGGGHSTFKKRPTKFTPRPSTLAPKTSVKESVEWKGRVVHKQ